VIWIPGVRLLFGPLSSGSSSVQRFFILSGITLGQLSLAVSLGFLVYAALSTASRKP
jgi:hypothetical protein